MKLVVFTEAGWKKGMGHFVRMSGICESCIAEGYEVTMVIDSDDEINDLIKRDYTVFSNWTNNNEALKLLDEETVLIVDSYTVELSFLQKCNSICNSMVVIDDNIRLPYEKMMVLNPNYFAGSLEYPEDRENTYFIGKDYTLLRKEFYTPFNRTINEVPMDVLVTMGGTDILGMTVKTIKKIRAINKEIRLHVVVTNAYSDLDVIKDSLNSNDNLYIGLNAEEMYNLMISVDFAIASAGGTSNELIKTKCPMALVVVAENQLKNAVYINDIGAAVLVDAEDMNGLEQMFSYEKRLQIMSALEEFASNKRATELVLELLERE